MTREFTYQWLPDEEDGPILKITKSSLGTFGFCPASYRMSYDPFNEGKIPQVTSEAMLRGTIVHDAQETFWKMVDTDKSIQYIDDPNALVKHFRELYPQSECDVTQDIYRSMSAWSAERFLECVEEGAIDNFIPAGNEIKLDAQFTLDGVRIHLQGIIDRIFLDKDGYIPLELKTGLWKDTGSKKTLMRKEMAFYQLLFEEATVETLEKAGLDPSIGVTHWGWFFPASNYVYVEEVKTRSMTAVLNSMRKLIKAYIEADFPYAFFIKKCVHCGHYGHCEAAQEDNNYDWF
tara:strand:- start:937 stop:1806 length:870 start_codon:yes stop_codon:yes gene_type:complete